jgi:hypothetical protein
MSEEVAVLELGVPYLDPPQPGLHHEEHPRVETLKEITERGRA